MENLYRTAVKVFVKKGEDIPAADFMPVFQRWIQKHTVPGTLIDVADYAHMHHGPGIVLVAHEHNTSIDYVDGRMGLLYNRKQPLDGSLQDDIRLCIKYALMACQELQDEPEFEGRLEFDGSNVLVIANDRLLAPHEADATNRFAESVRTVAGLIYSGPVDFDIKEDDQRDRVAIEIKANEPSDLRTLIAQCAGQEVG